MGIYCSADHIGGSDINVCRTLGDYDLGLPLKGRDEAGQQLGPLISGARAARWAWARALGAAGRAAAGAAEQGAGGLWDARAGPTCLPPALQYTGYLKIRWIIHAG